MTIIARQIGISSAKNELSNPDIMTLPDSSSFRNDYAKKRSSLTLFAILFVTLVCLSFVALDGWRSWEARKNQLQEMEVSTFNMARAIAQHADDTIKGADTALIGMVERIEKDGTRPAALKRLHLFLAMRVESLPQLNGLFIFDEQGRWMVHSQPTTPVHANNADRDYFLYHRNQQDSRPYIGLPIRSRSTGAWIITLSRRINHPDGSFAGVALATISIDYFNKFYDRFNVGEAGAIVLASDAGVLLTRRPLLADSIGKDMTETTLFHEYMRKRTFGSFTVKSAQDGVRRLNSFRHLEQYPLFISAALSEDEILAHWRTDTYLHAAGVIVLLIAQGAFGFHLIRQIKLRADAENELVEAHTALKKVNQQLEKLSFQDGLTGLANRRHFDLVLSEEFRRATRNNRPLALIMIDVDHFKQFNDMYGHTEGDECLRKISMVILKAPLRSADLAARYGGEEMCLILPDTDVKGALEVAEKIRIAIQDLQIPHSSSQAGIVTVSAGVSAMTPVRHVNLPLELVNLADHALYAAKNNGRNRSMTL
ncbi:sensor domain-containing diguanylate cyclase [Undibacterium sp. SXout7W]|uniref:sensor domain-containing diguanylate cyclase n=1 Tax=Undibacterium sp. SXout7W TaxID=3413049 RepID=UPI003BF0CCF1